MSEILETLDRETKKPVRTRVKDAAALYDIYKSAVDADSLSAQNRAQWRAMVDGEPPYDQAVLDETGQSDRSNIDLGYGRAAIQQTEAGYYDLISSVPILMTTQIAFGNPQQRSQWQPIISEGLTHLFRDWSKFEFNHQLLAHWFITDGVAVAYFEDDINWAYRVDSMENFKVPRGSEANEECLEISFLRRSFPANQLYEFIEDAEVARDTGWDVEAVKKLLLESSTEHTEGLLTDWEKMERDLKNNDLWCGKGAKTAVVKLVHAWVREMDGTISHYIIDEAGDCEDFIFESRSRFDNVRQALKVFTFGIGNGDYHSIRGKAYEVYPYAQHLNRLGNAVVDGAMTSSAVLIQPTSNDTRALDDLALTVYGPFQILPPGFSIIEKQLPNFANNALPAVNLLLQQMQNNTGDYATRATTADGQSRTAFEVRAQLQKEAGLSSSALDLFYGHWRVLLNESVRRIKREDYGADEPGGEAVAKFRRYCFERGVPMEAIHKIIRVEPIRAIGAGSASQRMLALTDMMGFFGNLDPVGQNNLIRDQIAARLGSYSEVDRYLPPIDSGARPVMDAKVALLENANLSDGKPQQVLANEDHFVHAQQHFPTLLRVVDGVSQGQVEGPAGLAALRAFVEHIAEHMQFLASDKLRIQEVALMRQTLQQVSALTQRLADQLQAQAEQAQQAEQADQARAAQSEQARVAEMERQLQEAQQPSPKTLAMMAETQARIQAKQAEAETNLEIKRATALQDLALKGQRAMAGGEAP